MAKKKSKQRKLEHEIAICGPTNEGCFSQGVELGSILGSIFNDLEYGLLEKFRSIATGCTKGFPEHAAKLIKQVKNKVSVVGYSPFADVKQWNEYEDMGAGDQEIYDKIIWPEKSKNVYEQGVSRMMSMIKNSRAVLANVGNKPTNTNLEIGIAAYLEVPAFILTNDKDRLWNSYKSTIKNCDEVHLYELNLKGAGELSNDLGDLLA